MLGGRLLLTMADQANFCQKWILKNRWIILLDRNKQVCTIIYAWTMHGKNIGKFSKFIRSNGHSFQWTTLKSQHGQSIKQLKGNKQIRISKLKTEKLTRLQLWHYTWSSMLQMCTSGKVDKYELVMQFQILKPKPGHLFVESFFLFEPVSMRFSSDFAFLLRALPASLRSSESLLFSSSKSGFAIPSFSSLNLRTYSNISIASSTL